MKPVNSLAHMRLGVLLSRIKDYENAEEAYKEGIKIDPNYPLIYFNASRCYAIQGKIDEALSNLSQAIEKGFDSWDLMVKDPEFKTLWDNTRFKELAEKVKVRWEEKQKKEGQGK